MTAWKRLWWSWFGEPIWIMNNKSYATDYKTVTKGRMKKVNAQYAIIFKAGHPTHRNLATSDGQIGKPDNTTRRVEYLWLPRGQYSTYSSCELFSKILAAKQTLPMLMGIDKELDRVITSELSKTEEPIQ